MNLRMREAGHRDLRDLFVAHEIANPPEVGASGMPTGAPTSDRAASATLVDRFLAADEPPASAELRRALKVVDASVSDYIDNARLKLAA